MRARFGSCDEVGSSAVESPPINFVGSVHDTTYHSKAIKPKRLHLIVPIFIALEYAVACTSAYVASSTYHLLAYNNWSSSEQGGAAAFLAGLITIVSISLRQFTDVQSQPRHRFLWNGLGAVALAFALLVSILFLLKIGESYSRGAFLFQIGFVSLAILIERATTHSWLQTAIAHGLVESRRIVVAGETAHCAEFIRRLRAPGLRVVSVLSIASTHGEPGEKAKKSGDEPSRILASCRAAKPDDAIVVCSHRNLQEARRLAFSLSQLPAGVHIFDLSAAAPFGAAHLASLGNMVTLQISHPPLSIVDQAIKRTLDIVLAASGLIVLSPLLILTAIAIAVDSPGPILFRQTRHGYNNEIIPVFKFRTMTLVEEGDNWTQAVRGDSRVTRVGRTLRRASIDEIPQLVNVLLGQMSIVGPRPHATAHNRQFESSISGLSRRHRVKPGITGWAQVNGHRGQTDTLEKMKRRIEHDLFYIENWSLLLDIKIIVMTLFSRQTYDNAY
jgi:Undecaprenyl-phosphate glucose phosphotransferase